MNLQIYDKLREFHSTVKELLQRQFNTQEENALEALNSVLYLVEKEFCTDGPKPPDYAAMAERKQFGKFWDVSKKYVYYQHLISYDSKHGYPFCTDGSDIFMHFIPMTEPEEIEL